MPRREGMPERLSVRARVVSLSSMGEQVQPTILFDGGCNLCNASARVVLARDRAGVFRLAPLQSAEGQRLLRRFDLPLRDFDTFVLIAGERVHLRSDAALQVARRLGGAWQLLYVLIIVPRALRDRAYDFVARRRYRWFGRAEQCTVRAVPTRSGKG